MTLKFAKALDKDLKEVWVEVVFENPEDETVLVQGPDGQFIVSKHDILELCEDR